MSRDCRTCSHLVRSTVMGWPKCHGVPRMRGEFRDVMLCGIPACGEGHPLYREAVPEQIIEIVRVVVA